MELGARSGESLRGAHPPPTRPTPAATKVALASHGVLGLKQEDRMNMIEIPKETGRKLEEMLGGVFTMPDLAEALKGAREDRDAARNWLNIGMTEASTNNFEIGDFVRVIDERDGCYGVIGPIVSIYKRLFSVQTPTRGVQKGFLPSELQHVSAVDRLAKVADAEEADH